MFFFFFPLLFLPAGAVPDASCTDGNFYLPVATACEDIAPSTFCQYFYRGDALTYAASPGLNANSRIPACYGVSKGSTIAGFNMAAALTCPKTCGLCCLTPAYSCKNADAPRVSCDSVSPSMCSDPLWHDVLVSDCPASCGFCLLGDCQDRVDNCAKTPQVCSSPDLQQFSMQNCRRTCGLCRVQPSSTNMTKCAQKRAKRAAELMGIALPGMDVSSA